MGGADFSKIARKKTKIHQTCQLRFYLTKWMQRNIPLIASPPPPPPALREE